MGGMPRSYSQVVTKHCRGEWDGNVLQLLHYVSITNHACEYQYHTQGSGAGFGRQSCRRADFLLNLNILNSISGDWCPVRTGIILTLKIMAYKIIDIQGVGPVYAEKLTAAGIDTVDQLLEAGKTVKGRKELEEKTGITGKLILTWVNHADLFRIKGVGPQFAELLEAAGVDTVKEFGHRVAANLVAKMQEVNEQKHLTKVVPTVDQVQAMIDQAKELPGLVTY